LNSTARRRSLLGMIRAGLILACLLAAAGGVACGHLQPVDHPLYPGPARPSGEVARLSGPLALVDGADVSGLGSSFALLPGCHVVELQKRIGEGSTSGAWSADLRHRVYAFKMQAGHSYEIDVQLRSGNESVGNGTVGAVKITAVERDARGTAVGFLAPVRNNAEVQACRASADDSVERKPESGVALPPPAPARQEEEQDPR
jgi:hypothetical protein